MGKHFGNLDLLMPMRKGTGIISDVELRIPIQHLDERGYFSVKYHNKFDFKQLNISCSHKNVIRGLHYQHEHPQAKLVSCVKGSIVDVIVDLRKDSDTFGKWMGIELKDPTHCLYVPKGCAHGFLVTSDEAYVEYLVDEEWYPDDERTLWYKDPEINIDWEGLGLTGEPIVSEKDEQGMIFLFVC